MSDVIADRHDDQPDRSSGRDDRAGGKSHPTMSELHAEVAELRREVAELRAEHRSPRGRPREAGTTAGLTEDAPRSRRHLFGLAGASFAAAAVGSTLGRDRRAAAADPNDVVRNISNPVVDTTTLDGSFEGPVFGAVNRSGATTAAGFYARSAGSTSPTVRADNQQSAGLGGVALGGNAPGGRDVHAFGSGRIAMSDHDYTPTRQYDAGELHQSGGTLFAMVTPSVRRVLAGPFAAGALHPVTPTRVFDSRRPRPAFGRIGTGDVRIVSAADGRDLVSGAVTVPDLVPVGATAVQFTVTVVHTAGRGYLSVLPTLATSVTASTINWRTDDLVLANSSLARLDGNRNLSVHCGGRGSTDFVIDVVGYYR